MSVFNRASTYSDIDETIQTQLWQLLNSDEVVYAMQVVSDFGLSAVLGAEKRLLEHNLVHTKSNPQPGIIDNDRRKQCIGAMVRQVMEANGYQIIAGPSARTRRSLVFTSGARYEAS